MTNQPKWLKAKNIQQVFALLAQNGGEGRIVGGAVRDHLMDVDIGDVDFCSTHRPEQLIEIAKTNQVRYIETGVKYGTLTLLIDGQNFEVTSLRQDVETDGRHAKTIYGTSFKQDAKRRDFTFNALYMDAKGKIFDPLNTGIADLKAHKIKYIGDAGQRIQEDYLRILRYFRFIARYDFDYDDEDFKQISAHVTGLSQLSAERLLAEFKRIYASEFLIQTLKLMNDNGIFLQIFGSNAKLDKLNYLQNSTLTDKNIWLIRLSLSLLNVKQDKLIKTLKLSNKDQKTLNQMNQLPDILQSDSAELSKQIYLFGKDKIHQNLVYFAAETNFNSESLEQKLNFVTKSKIPTFPINGADLFAAGFEAGPKMGQVIKQLEALWLDSNFTKTKAELLKAI